MRRGYSPILLDGNSLTINDAEAIGHGARVLIARASKKQVELARRTVLNAIKLGEPVYGVNTGFGVLSQCSIDPSQLLTLQKNLLLSHAAGWGDPLPLDETRLAVVLRLNILLKGYTGVRFRLCQAMQKLLDADILPYIPEVGSVGASGDLAPLAHLALPLIGQGMAHYGGKIMAASEALRLAKLRAIHLTEKEGLSLVNGTQIMLAVGTLAVIKAKKLAVLADNIAALSAEALLASTTPFDERIHEARGQLGQKKSAETIRSALTGSFLYNLDRTSLRLQDPYSIRCAPQVHGASYDALYFCLDIIQRELNGVTDNPLVFSADEAIISAGNFHGQVLALPFDYSCMAAAELGNISERRLELLLNPAFSGLTPFLTANPGLESGYMAMQYLAASLVSSNKILTHPASTDSIPGNCGIEDHVSMGMTAAIKLRKIVSNLRAILACELLAACQALDLRAVSASMLGEGSRQLYTALRGRVEPLRHDRIISEDIAKGVEVIDALVAQK